MTNSKERTYFLFALLIGATILSFMVLQPFLITIALAAIFAVVLQPVHRVVSDRLKLPKGLSAFVTLLLGCLFVITPLALIGTLVVGQSSQAYTELMNGTSITSAQQVATSIGSWLEPYIPGATAYIQTLSLELNTYATQALQWLLQHVGVAFASILGLLLRLLIFLMALYYFLKEGAALEQVLIKKSPLLDEDAAAIFKKLSRTVSSVVNGSLAIACIQGLLAGIGFFIFGVPNAALWGVTTALAALIPGVGTSLVLIPAIIYLFAVGNTVLAIGLLLWGTLLVGLIDNFLSPRLMGRGAQLHPLVILLSVLGGVVLYGPAGLFLGPLTISLLYAVYTVYSTQTPTA